MAYQSFNFRLIYVFRINDESHRGCLKVGETTLHEYVANPLDLAPNSKELNKDAHKRIQQYTSTAGVMYDLLYTELTASVHPGKIIQFNDKQVHDVLLRSGIKKKCFDNGKKANEWFICSLEQVKAAIQAAKEGRNSIDMFDVETAPQHIVFRPEQLEAIKQTQKRFKTNNQFLWNAKMRFGKTLSALQVVREMELDKVLILTHRPVVDEGWFEDFNKIFFDLPNYKYGSKTKGETFGSLLNLNAKGTHFVYFASIQDLRGSAQVGGIYDKNSEVFSTNWDLLIVDEAHEGTKTALGQAVLKELFKGNTKMLQLSGTPFNLFDDYKEEDIYTWDYVMEQRAKADWDKTHWGDPNPYACLPKLNIYTFDLSLELKKYQDDEHAFNFAEFFRVRDDGNFVHDEDVTKFLNLLASDNAKGYPYSTLEWRRNFRHTLWTVPSVAAAAALSTKLRNHQVFGQFRIVNVAGEGDTDADYESDDALKMVKEAISDNPDETFSITLSRGRLTTGVSVPAWTAVFMLHGSFSTSASSYMQTIFRAQTPAIINGKQKEECYVFDFAPDRTLKVLTETAKVSAKAGKSKSNDKQILGEFLNFCPVISFHGAQMSSINVDHMMQQLKRVYVDRVVRNGFEDTYLYNDKLMKLDHVELEKFANLRDIIGQTKAMKHTDEVDVNKQGFTNEEYEQLEKLEKKPKKQLTPEELEELNRLKEKKTQRNTAISILRGISIRMPMIIYGADIKDEESEITLENFTSLVDDQSWEEFMPKGVTKELFEEFIPYYDEDIFTAAGIRIRKLAREADEMDIEERIERITTIFTSFRNPDKETVLTPWRVVNMQLADTLGGWCFYDEDFKERLVEPRFVTQGEVTKETLTHGSRVLEINSKSGLYPLYVAYSIFRDIKDRDQMSWMITDTAVEDRVKRHHKIWDDVLKNNLFIICKTPMAKSITRRTLVGFRENAKINAHYFDDLINQISNKKQQFIKRVTDAQGYWGLKNITEMKFNAVVGNPPYQIVSNVNNRQNPIYHYFYDIAESLSDVYSLISPARFLFNAGLTPEPWNLKMLNDEHLKVVYFNQDATACFPTIEIKGGIAIMLRNAKENFGAIKQFIPDSNLQSIASKFAPNEETNLPSIMFGGRSDLKFNQRFLTDYPNTKDDRLKFIQQKHPAVVVLGPNEEYELKSSTFEALPYVFKDSEIPGEKCYHLLSLENMRRTWKYIERKYMDPRYPQHNNIDKYKVFVPKANGSGALGESLSKLEIGCPGDSSSSTFISIGAFDTKEEAKNCALYIRTKFARCLLGILKKTQDNPPSVWAYIPVQDFTKNSDIDWSKSISEIDKQLYEKYNLSPTEQSFIDTTVKSM